VEGQAKKFFIVKFLKAKFSINKPTESFEHHPQSKLKALIFFNPMGSLSGPIFFFQEDLLVSL